MIFTSDEVTSENHWQIASRVIKITFWSRVRWFDSNFFGREWCDLTMIFGSRMRRFDNDLFGYEWCDLTVIFTREKHRLSMRKKNSVHTELIKTSISSLWNQWSERMCNKEHKSNPFPISFSSVIAEFLPLTNFLFRPIWVCIESQRLNNCIGAWH